MCRDVANGKIESFSKPHQALTHRLDGVVVFRSRPPKPWRARGRRLGRERLAPEVGVLEIGASEPVFPVQVERLAGFSNSHAVLVVRPVWRGGGPYHRMEC